MASETTVIKNSCLSPGATPAYMTFDEITAEFKAIRRMPIAQAGTAYTEASSALVTAANNLITHATKLAGIWGGEAADKHLAQFQKLHETVTGLADKAFVAGRAYTWFASPEMLGWYRDTGGNLQQSSNPFHDDDATAREFRDRFLARLGEAVNGGPDSVSKNLPDPGTSIGGYGPSGPGSGGPHVGGGGGGMPKMPIDHSGGLPNSTLPTDPNGHFPNGNDPSGNLPNGNGPLGTDPSGNLPNGNLPGGNLPNGGGSSLQHFPLDGGGLGSGGLGSGGLGSGGLGSGGLGGGLGSGGLGSGPGGLPGGGLAGSGGPGAGALAAERAALARAGTNGMGMGMPMGAGGGGGNQSEERERSTWLMEDEDIWGGGGDTAPPVIG